MIDLEERGFRISRNPTVLIRAIPSLKDAYAAQDYNLVAIPPY